MSYKRIPLEKFDFKKSFSPMEEMGFFVNCEEVPFNNEESKFDVTNAWWMAEHSRLSYIKNKDDILEKLLMAGYHGVKFIWNKKTGTKLYVAWNYEHIVISFTGTELDEGCEDIKADLDFLPTKSGQGGLVHRGFKKAFQSIWIELKLLLEKLDTKPIWITGHSLGGALAVLTASRMKAKSCYTFGCPRVGSTGFNKTIKTPIYRVSKNNDIVTRIPTPPIYHHHGNNQFITNNQKLLENPRWLKMFKERLGGSELLILWLLIKVVVFRSSIDFILGYLHGHSPYNYSVFMWNNIDK